MEFRIAKAEAVLSRRQSAFKGDARWLQIFACSPHLLLNGVLCLDCDIRVQIIDLTCGGG